MTCFGKLETHNGCVLRFDSRVYLRDIDKPSPTDQMVAAIVGKNPGSARLTENGGNANAELGPLRLGGGKVPPIARKCFLDAYAQAGIPVPANGYIQLWNLFYLEDADLKSAIKKLDAAGDLPFCPTEQSVPPIVWFAWGRPAKHGLDRLASRFLNASIAHPFYYCMNEKKVVPEVPPADAGAKHPQGLPTEAVKVHLTTILRSLAE